MSMVIAPSRAADDDSEITLVGYDQLSDMTELGDDVTITDPDTGDSWLGVVIEVDPGMRCMFVKVNLDTFRPRYTVSSLEDMEDADLFENKSSGKLYTLNELNTLGQSKNYRD